MIYTGRSGPSFFAVDPLDCNHQVLEASSKEKSIRVWNKFKNLKNNIFTIYYLFPLSISCNLNLLFKYLIKYLNYDKFLEDFLRYFFKSEFENFSNILGEFFKNDAHLFLNYFLYIVN